MRPKTFLALCVLSALCVLTYWYVRVKSVPSPPVSRLLDFEEEALAAMMVLSPGGEELSFHREAGKWMVTDGRTGCIVPIDSLQAIVNQLAALDTRGIRIGTEGELLLLGLGEGEALRVRLYGPNRLQDDILIGRIDSVRQRAPLRFWGQGEVFTLPASLVGRLQRGVGHYCNGPLLELPAPEEVDSVHYRLLPDSVEAKIRATAGGWSWDDAPLSPEDSLRWRRYLAALGGIRPDEPAKDFDELQADRWAKRSLVFYFHAGDSAVLECFYRPGRRHPFVLRSSQRPYHFFQSDSFGLFAVLFGVPEELRGGGVTKGGPSFRVE